MSVNKQQPTYPLPVADQLISIERYYQKRADINQPALENIGARGYIVPAVEQIILKNNLNPTDVGSDRTSALSEGKANVAYSLFGLPLWDIIQIRNQSGELFTFNIALAEISQVRNIVTTAVQGLYGTIKEYISDGDYQISINAYLIGDAMDYYPQEDVVQLNKLLRSKTSLNVTSIIMNKYFNINSIVITDYSFNQPKEGTRNVQNVKINAISDDTSGYSFIIL